jgi:hypothetical protein
MITFCTAQLITDQIQVFISEMAAVRFFEQVRPHPGDALDQIESYLFLSFPPFLIGLEVLTDIQASGKRRCKGRNPRCTLLDLQTIRLGWPHPFEKQSTHEAPQDQQQSA